ncbi:MAG: hypothetical protein HQ494_15385, partial [Rhodospirillales bacterium]|nr:hypothetical protein [Rhodospirillales bacterium]
MGVRAVEILCGAKKFKGNVANSLIGVVALGWVLLPRLEAAEISCDALMEALSGSREIPGFIINPADETVRIRTSKGECSESIEAWSQRDSLAPAKAKAAKPKSVPAPKVEPKADPEAVTVTPEPVPVEPEGFKKLTPRQRFTPPTDTGPVQKFQAPLPPATTPNPVTKKPNAQATCDYRIGEIWESQVIEIEGIDHWLARAFTMDINEDLEVDNVSFTFIALDGSEKVIHYFAALGGVSGWAYPALALPNEELIPRLCFDDLKYKKPKFFDTKKLESTLIEVEKPDLAAELEAKESGIAYKPKTTKKKPIKREEPTPWWLWAAAGGGGLVVVAGGAVFFRRRGKKSKTTGDDEDEEDVDAKVRDEDEDEDKPKPKKKGLGALLARFTKAK